MSPTVPAALLEQAQRGPAPDDEFVDGIRPSSPDAWTTVERLAKQPEAGDAASGQNVEVPRTTRRGAEVFRLVGRNARRSAGVHQPARPAAQPATGAAQLPAARAGRTGTLPRLPELRPAITSVMSGERCSLAQPPAGAAQMVRR